MGPMRLRSWNELMRARSLTAALLAMLAMVHMSMADEDTDSEQDEVAVEVSLPEEVVRAGRIYEAGLDPFAVAETVDLGGAAGVGFSAALEQAAGVEVRSSGSAGQPETVSLRAFGDMRTAMMVEGVRVDSISGLSFDLSVLDPLSFEQAEIIKGPSSTLFGSGAMGGAVNLKIARPRKSGVSLVGKLGSFGTAQGAAALATAGGRAWNVLSLSAMSTEGNYRFLNDNGTEFTESDDFFDTRDNSHARRVGGLAKGECEIFGDSSLGWLVMYQELWRGSPGLVNFPSARASTHEHAGLSVADVSSLLGSSVSLAARLSAATRGYEFADPLGEQTGVAIRSSQDEFDPHLTVRLDWQPAGFAVLFAEAGAGRNVLDDSAYGGRSRDILSGIAGTEVWPLADALGLSAAVRYDSFSDERSAMTPRVAAKLIPCRWLEFKLSYAEAYRVPSFAELYFNQGFVEGNPDLEPERTSGVDAQALVRTRLVSASAVGFYQRAWDLIEYTLMSGFRYRPINVGRAEIYGVELSTTAGVGPLELSGSYAHTEALDDTDDPNRSGNQLPGRPKDSGYVRALARADEFFVYTDARGVAGSYLNIANTKLIDAYVLFGSGLGIESGPFKAQVELVNILDEQAFDIRGLPLMGRSVYLTVGYRGF